MMAFHVGQHVVCVERFTNVITGSGIPEKGAVYTVREVYDGLGPHGRELGLRLVEFSRQPHIGNVEAGFAASRFRPLQKLNIQDFITERETA